MKIIVIFIIILSIFFLCPAQENENKTTSQDQPDLNNQEQKIDTEMVPKVTEAKIDISKIKIKKKKREAFGPADDSGKEIGTVKKPLDKPNSSNKDLQKVLDNPEKMKPANKK